MRLNYIFNALSLILIYIGIVILTPSVVALYYKDFASVMPFLSASLIAVFTGFLMKIKYPNKMGLNDIRKSEALFVVALSWIVFSLIAAIPYFFYGLSPLNCFFEAVSGITTTGATILTHFDYPKTMFFWRAMSQWLGGMGIIVLFTAILPQFAVAGRQMFFAEAPGPTEDKITPRIKHTATALWGVYIGLTLIEIVLLKIAGMPLFEAVCNSFATLSAGGFATNGQSILGYHSGFVIWIITFFMFLSSANFALQYKVFVKGKFNLLFKNEEFKLYAAILFFMSLFVALILYFDKMYPFLSSMREAFFQIVSMMSSTGFTSSDFQFWPAKAKVLVFAVMLIGGCAGSAGAGIKVVRLLFVFKYLKKEIKKILHPQAIIPIKLEGITLSRDVVHQMLTFIIFYYLIFLVSAIFVTIIENNIIVGLSGSITTLGNIGPGFEQIGPMGNYDSLQPITKVIFIGNMIVGRLELIPFIAMLHPDFWRIRAS